MIRTRSTARAAVKEDDRLAVWIAAELPIEAVTIANVEMSVLIRFNLGIERTTRFGGDVHQKLNSS